MSQFFVFVISGLVAGAIYSIFASGLTLLYSATGIFNFAYGAMSFIAGLFFYELGTVYLPRWAAFAVTVLVLAPLSAIIVERVAFRRLARGPEVQRVIGTIGLVVGLPAAGFLVVRLLVDDLHLGLASVDSVYSVPGIGPQPAKVYRLFGSGTINSNQIIVLVGTAVAVGGLWLLMTRTRLGLTTRAMVDRPEFAATRGVNPARTSMVVWILGTMLASLAGVLAGPLYGLSSDTALQFVVAASAIVVMARFRSLPIAMVGGLVLGALASIVAGYGSKVPGLRTAFNSIPGLRSSIIYLALLVALLWRGHQRVRVAGVSAVAEPVPPDYLADLPTWRRRLPWVAMGVVLVTWVLGLLPWSHVVAGKLELTLVIQGLGLAIVFLSFTVVVGMLGVASLAQATFVTAGALIAGMIVDKGYLGGGFIVAVLVAGLVAAALGVVVALPALRLGGLALALATLALAYLGDQILFQINALQNYTSGWRLKRPVLGPFDFRNDRSFAVLLLVVVLVSVWVVNNIRRSRTGRAIMAVRFSAPAASAVGISTRRAIVTAFALSGFLAGVGGALFAYSSGAASPTTYPAQIGLLWLTIAVLWGVRRPAGAVLGGVTGALFGRILQTGFWGILPAISDPTVPTIFFGLTCIALARQPDGLLSDMTRSRAEARQRRRRKREAQGRPAPVPATAAVPGPAPAAVPGAASAAAPADGAPPRPPERVTAVTGRLPVPPAGPDGPAAALELRQVVAGYVDSEVLHGVDLIVPRRSIVAVLGPNGMGKSTLCGAIAGTVAVSSGTIMVDGRDVTALPSYRRTGAGLILAPESRGIFPALSVEENLEVSLPSARDRDRALERFPPLAARRKLPAGSLSGGEQQMLCLAPILVHPPTVLVADEISLGLAPAIVAQIIGFLGVLRDEGVSVLMVEEKARNVLDLADYCAFLSQGRITAWGPTAGFTDVVTAQSYLGAAVAGAGEAAEPGRPPGGPGTEASDRR